MIHKWNELDFYHFDEFLSNFENGDEWTKKVVLELQDPYSILLGKQKRVFLGYGIKVKDYEKYNERFLKLVNILQSGVPDLNILEKESLSLCYLSKEEGPVIVPLVGSDSKGGSRSVVRHMLFGDTNKEADIIGKILNADPGPGVWYEKDPDLGRVLWIPQRKGISQNNRIIRFRTIDLEDWKRLISDWINGNTEEISKDDLKKEDFEIQPEVAKMIYNITQQNGGFDKIFGNKD